MLYLSRYLIEYKNEYYALLRGVTEAGAWEPWVLHMLDAIEKTALWTTGRILAIRELFDRTRKKAKRELPRNIYSKELIELIFIQPYCKAQFIVDAGLAERRTAMKYLKSLEEIEVLQGLRVGRERLFIHPALVEILTQ